MKYILAMLLALFSQSLLASKASAIAGVYNCVCTEVGSHIDYKAQMHVKKTVIPTL